MADLWFYTTDGQAKEPVNAAELREMSMRGALKPTDLVWSEGMPQWIRAGSVPNLFPAESGPAARVETQPAREAELVRAEAPVGRGGEAASWKRSAWDQEERPRRPYQRGDDDRDEPDRRSRRRMGRGAKWAIVGGSIVAV